MSEYKEYCGEICDDCGGLVKEVEETIGGTLHECEDCGTQYMDEEEVN